MPLVSMRQLLDHAAEYDYGVPAFNVNNLEQTRAMAGTTGDSQRINMGFFNKVSGFFRVG